MANDPLERILREHGSELLDTLAERLTPTDLQSLLMEVYRRRALTQSPARLLEQHENSRFAMPSPADPLALLAFDQRAYGLAEGFEPIELAPLSPLGTTAALTTVSQNNVVPTARNVEVLSDPTNVMALEAASRRKRSPEPVRLCTACRVTRAQGINAPKSWAHFKLFALVSAGRDEGSYRFEIEELVRHIGFHLRLVEGFKARVALTNFAGDLRREAHRKIAERLRATFPQVTVEDYPEREAGRGYYDASCFQIHTFGPDGEEYFLADGGITDWTQKLLSNKKERLIISGFGAERFCSVFR